MNRLTLKLAATFAACALLTASVPAMDISAGIKGGLNLSGVYGADDDEGLKMRSGLNIGAVLELKFTDMIALQPEVAFSSKGLKIENDADNFMVIGLNYLEIPVLFKVIFPVSGVTPCIYAGPDFAFRTGISGSYTMDGKKEDFTDEEIDNMEDRLKGFDFGLAMGAGLKIPAGPGGVLVDVRYTLGFIDLNNSDDDDGKAGKNHALSFLVGYTFDIGGN